MPKDPEKRARAIEWLMGFQQELPQSRSQEWEQWIADPEHQTTFDQIAELWKRTGNAEPLPLPDASELAVDEYDGTDSVADWFARQTMTCLDDGSENTWKLRQQRRIGFHC